MAMAMGWNECLVNGEPLGEGWSLETVQDWDFATVGSGLRCFLRTPEGTTLQLDERRDWVVVDGKHVWGTPPRISEFDVSPMRPEPDRITGKIIGYRGWTLDGYKLRSANHRQHGGFWNIGPNKAECRIGARREFLGISYAHRHPLPMIKDQAPAGHVAPHPDCECGLYAYFDVRRENNPHNFRPESLVWGAVAAWGRVEVHSSGFRAEYAEPVVLAYGPRDPYEDVVNTQTIAGELGLPFVTFDELPAEAAKHGQTVPESMRPAAAPGFGSGGLVGSSLFTFEANAASAVVSIKSLSERILALGSVMAEREAAPLSLPWEILESKWTHAITHGPTVRARTSKPKLRAKGIKKTLKTNGPPTLGKWQLNDRVKDRRGDVWLCVKPGAPGTWERAE